MAQAKTTARKSTAKPKANPNTPVLMICTKRGVQNFRRAGFAFTREPIGIARVAITDEQYDALINEPRLDVEEGTIDSADVTE